MAHIDATSISAARPGVGTRLASFFVRLMEARARALRLDERRAELDRLMALDDRALFRRGLRRDDLPRYVFRDMLLF